jgi:hypothetical protein
LKHVCCCCIMIMEDSPSGFFMMCHISFVKSKHCYLWPIILKILKFHNIWVTYYDESISHSEYKNTSLMTWINIIFVWN